MGPELLNVEEQMNLIVVFRNFVKASRRRQGKYIQPNKCPPFSNNTKLKDPENVAYDFNNLFLNY